jgi:hypothetical protein
MVREMGGAILFGRPAEHELWSTRLRHRDAEAMRFRMGQDPDDQETVLLRPAPDDAFLALTVRHGDKVVPVGEKPRIREGDVAELIVHEKHRAEALLQLRGDGWVPMADDAGDDAESSTRPAKRG